MIKGAKLQSAVKAMTMAEEIAIYNARFAALKMILQRVVGLNRNDSIDFACNLLENHGFLTFLADVECEYVAKDDETMNEKYINVMHILYQNARL